MVLWSSWLVARHSKYGKTSMATMFKQHCMCMPFHFSYSLAKWFIYLPCVEKIVNSLNSSGFDIWSWKHSSLVHTQNAIYSFTWFYDVYIYIYYIISYLFKNRFMKYIWIVGGEAGEMNEKKMRLPWTSRDRKCPYIYTHAYVLSKNQGACRYSMKMIWRWPTFAARKRNAVVWCFSYNYHWVCMCSECSTECGEFSCRSNKHPEHD